MLYRYCLKNFYWKTIIVINTILVLTGIFYISSTQANISNKPTTYLNKEKYYYSKNIFVEVRHFRQAVKLFHWLDLIKLTQTGSETLKAIEDSGNQLLIYHSNSALLSAGVTGAPLSRNLTNGVGEDVYIKFYLDMESHGSNCVLGKNGKYINYLAIHNLLHELIHARHKMNGTWLYFNSEGQAIREENKFRKDWAKYRSTQYNLRTEYIVDEAIVINHNGSCIHPNNF